MIMRCICKRVWDVFVEMRNFIISIDESVLNKMRRLLIGSQRDNQ